MKAFCKIITLLVIAFVSSSGIVASTTGNRALAQDAVAKIEKAESNTEYWLGTVDVGSLKLRLRIDIRQGDSKPTGNLVSIDQGGAVIPLDILTITDNEFSFSVESLQIKYQGKREELGDAVTGTFRQGGATFELNLRRVSKDDANPAKRPQTPVEPFPYNVHEVVFSNEKASNITLSGTLTIPHQPKGEKLPAVVLVSGSGPQDRDETLLGHKPFWIIADHLSRHGIVVLRYDDRGVGESTGDFATATTPDFAGDAQAAIDHLLSLPEVDGNRIGVIGHSEGGIVAAMLAASDTPPTHAVMLAGTGLPGDEILLSQGDAILRRSGTEETEAQRELRQDLIALGKAGASLEEFQKRADRYVAEIKKTAGDDAKEDSAKEATEQEPLDAGITRLATPWFQFFLNHDPRTDLQRAKCPVYALIGENDLQVLADINMPAIETALAESGTQGHRYERFPGLNHLFQHSATGLPSDYGKIEETFAPKVLALLVEWVLSH